MNTLSSKTSKNAAPSHVRRSWGGGLLKQEQEKLAKSTKGGENGSSLSAKGSTKGASKEKPSTDRELRNLMNGIATSSSAKNEAENATHIPEKPPVLLAGTEFSARELSFALEIISGKLIGQEINSSQQDVLFHKAQNSSLHLKITAQLKKTQESQKSSGILGIVLKVLSGIVIALSLVITAALTVVSLGTGSWLMAASLALGVALTIAVLIATETGGIASLTQTVSSAIERDLIANGADKKTAKLAGLILGNLAVSGTIMALQLGLSITSLVGGACSFAGKAMEVASKLASFIIKTSTYVARGAAVVTGAVEVVQGGVSETLAYYDYTKALSQSETARYRGVVTYTQDLLKNDTLFNKEIVDMSSKAFVSYAEIESSRHAVEQQVADNISA